MSPEHLDVFNEKVDLIQIGARNMQNFDLLKQLGQVDRPILLKRGLNATYEEWMMSAEYIMASGNENVILCERGIRTFETYTRNTLDLQSIPVLRKLTHLPVIVDPSHAGGKWWLVESMAKASHRCRSRRTYGGGTQCPGKCAVRRRPVIKAPEIRRTNQGSLPDCPGNREKHIIGEIYETYGKPGKGQLSPLYQK